MTLITKPINKLPISKPEPILKKISVAIIDEFTLPEIRDTSYPSWETKTYLSHGERVELVFDDWCYFKFGENYKDYIQRHSYNRCKEYGPHSDELLNGAINEICQKGSEFDYVNTSFSIDSKKQIGTWQISDNSLEESREKIKEKRAFLFKPAEIFGYRWYTGNTNEDTTYSSLCVLNNTCVSADRLNAKGQPFSQCSLVDKHYDPRLHLIAYDKMDDDSNQLYWGVDRNCNGKLDTDELHSNKAVDKRATFYGRPVEAGDVFAREDGILFEGVSYSTPRALVDKAWEDYQQRNDQLFATNLNWSNLPRGNN